MAMLSYLLTFLAVLFWLFRLVVAFAFSMDMDIGFTPLNMTFEIVLLFVTVPCIILVFKRNLIAAVVYLALYISYFGKNIYDTVMGISGGMKLTDATSVFVSIIGIAIPLFTTLDIALNKERKGSGGSRKTNWFYDNPDYDRKFDERADKNNYKF